MIFFCRSILFSPWHLLCIVLWRSQGYLSVFEYRMQDVRWSWCPHRYTHSHIWQLSSQTLCKPFIFLPCFGLLFVPLLVSFLSFLLPHPALLLFNYAARMKRREGIEMEKRTQGRRSSETLAKVCYIFNDWLKIF